MMTRRELANRAIELVGGTAGLIWKKHDPDGFFDLVTEGRQAFHSYSSCQDLVSRLALEACGMKGGMTWCNRVDGQNKWIAGQNLIRIKQHASYAWKDYTAGCVWDIQVGDGIEISNVCGGHTFVATEIKYDDQGNPVVMDHADYGQLGPGCKLYLDVPVKRDPEKRWTIGGHPIIGRLSILDLSATENGFTAYPEPDGAA